jgi:RimJ/RimL family protein N-acetyltransferase
MENNSTTSTGLRGETVRLAAINPETDSATSATWSLNAEFQKFYSSWPARPRTAKWMHDNMAASQAKAQPSDAEFSFNIRTLADDRLIGESNLELPSWPNRDAWVSIGLGLSADWGKGYGTDAMRLLLRYAFSELNLERVSLSTYGYNERAQRSYLKAGFTLEGRQRESLRRDDLRWDMVYMGILRDEWLAIAGR